MNRRLARIRERRDLEIDRDRARILAEAIVRTIRESLLVLDEDLKVVSANPAFESTFFLGLEELRGKKLEDLGPWAVGLPELLKHLAGLIPERASLEDMELEIALPGLGKRFMRMSAMRVVDEERFPALLLVALQDVTEKLRHREIIESLNRTFFGLCSDYLENMDVITNSCHSILKSDMALYLRFEADRLIALGTGRDEGGAMVLPKKNLLS